MNEIKEFIGSVIIGIIIYYGLILIFHLGAK